VEALILTDNPRNFKGNTVEAVKDAALIITSDGKYQSSQTLPTKVQNNIGIEKISFSDKTTNDATTLKHGLLPKLSGVATQFLNGLGAWAVPPSPTKSDYFGNIWWVKTGEKVTIEDTRENVVSNMIVDGTLVVDGILTVL
jgi:hypothetical protein